MVKCPTCHKTLEKKEGTKKLCAQIGNPEIAVVETTDPLFCGSCNEYFLDTSEMISAVTQIKEMSSDTKTIEKGVYN